MKRVFYLISFSFIILVLSVNNVYADELLDNIYKETMAAYYNRGITTQYNSVKLKYYEPEDSRRLNNQYTVCSHFTNNVLINAFGFNSFGGTDVDIFPDVSPMNKFTVNVNPDLNDIDNVLTFKYYKDYPKEIDSSVTNKCSLMNENDYNSLIQSLKPGDIINYNVEGDSSGHSLMVYDVFSYQDNDGNTVWDALIVHSTTQKRVLSKIKFSLDHPYYGFGKSYLVGTNLESFIPDELKDVATKGEGGIRLSSFRSIAALQFNKANHCYKTSNGHYYGRDYSITSFVVKEGDAYKHVVYDSSKDKSNYSLEEFDIDKSVGYTRTKLKNIYIEKNMSKEQNDVLIGDKLEYKVTIKNNSNTNYGKFSVFEVINTGDSNKYSISNVSNNGEFSDDTITWDINSLDAHKSIELKYTVTIDNDKKLIGEDIVNYGYLNADESDGLPIVTGRITNNISYKLDSEQKKDIKESFNYNKDKYKGLELIDNIYNDLGYDFKFSDFDIHKLISVNNEKMNTCTNKRNCSQTYELLKYDIKDSKYTYGDIILNNYNNLLVNADGTAVDDTDEINGLDDNDSNDISSSDTTFDASAHVKIALRWRMQNYFRNQTIYNDSFENGDVLIYENNNDVDLVNNISLNDEQGIYAYIYIDGKFVGVNGEGKAKRDVFDYSYYKNNNYNLTNFTKDSKLDDSLVDDDNLEFMQLQTLFGKNAYVILRPSKVIEPRVSSSPNVIEELLVGVPNTLSKVGIIIYVLATLSIVTGTCIICYNSYYDKSNN